MWNPFKRIPKKTPEKGSVWVFKEHIEDGNPFRKNILRVRVKAVQNGWVNYAFLPESPMFQDESMKLDSFLHCYTPDPF